MTERLYYENSYLTEFQAEIVDVRQDGERWAARLDRTAFYPTSGGQPHDTGTISSARVIEVDEDESGTIRHFLDSNPGTGPAACRIDRERRFDFMQQHTGQHILSQAFIQSADAATLSFHLGAETSTIDVALENPSDIIMEKTEQLASMIVFQNRQLKIHSVDRSGLAALGIRKETQREGPIRVIEVEDFDRSACGGTHVRSSGEVGVIAILGYERYKGGTRVEFVCGGRALKTLRKDHEVLRTLGRLYSGHPYEVPDLTAKLMEERSALTRENARLTGQVLEFEAAALAANTEPVNGIRLVQARFDDRGIDQIKLLAQKIAFHPATVAVLVLNGATAQAVAARSADVSVHCGSAIKAAVSRHGGRGGGRPELAQAGGIPAESLDGWIQVLVQGLISQ